ncbi:MAG: hypothetical protein COA40_02700 [Aequorivita sp.]|nr:MAG: hypothetical protein COA40_02700 [Aequorivita sp.]
MKKSLLFILCLTLFTSCSVQKGYIKFDGKTDEIISSNALKEHLENYPNSSIVLRVPETSSRSTESESNSYIYNAIEKELILNGFDVKDRGLYNAVMDKSKELSYEEIKKITGTDLILEVLGDFERKYKTNQFYDKNGKKLVEPGVEFQKFGAEIEFKITIIEGNIFGGSYLFYYTPCAEQNSGCECEVIYKAMPQTVYMNRSFCRDPKVDERGYESVPTDRLSDFVRSKVKLMLKELQK